MRILWVAQEEIRICTILYRGNVSHPAIVLLDYPFAA